jgi:predicted flavoprotein YhiN
LVTLSINEPVTESSRGAARQAAMAGNQGCNLTDEAPFRAVDYSANLSATKSFTTHSHSTPYEGEKLVFENSNEELEYPQRKNTR